MKKALDEPKAEETKSDGTHLYEREFSMLEKVKEIASARQLSAEELRRQLVTLGNEFDKLLRNTVKINKVADANQRKLLRMLELEREKLRLEQVVKERTQEIEEKNHRLEEQTQQLQEKSEMLKRMSENKSRFFANISHEFRTPLTLIMAPLEQMLSDPGDEKTAKTLKLMLRNSQRLLGLINQLLELAKYEGGSMELQTGRHDIVAFLQGIIASFELLAVHNELALVFRTENEDTENEDNTEPMEIPIFFDPGKMENLICNLLTNAMKFTPPGGEVSVTVKTFPGAVEQFPEGYIEISVRDTGPGIPADQLAHVFDRFFQADTTYEHHRKGSGIGLALSQELVKLHHGTIEARNRKGSGSRFIICLPMGSRHLEPDEITDQPYSISNSSGSLLTDLPLLQLVIETEETEEEEASEIQLELEAGAGANKKDIILVVEDNKSLRQYVKSALVPDYKVVVAGDGKEGIQKAKEIIPDLIISDIMMPQADGYELCRVLKTGVETSHIPIILLTAKASEDNILEGLETGADDYVAKPFNTKLLIARIKNLIQLRRQLQKHINKEITRPPEKAPVSKIDREFLRDLHDTITGNLSDPEFNVEELRKKLYMGRTTLYRKVLALSGLSPTEFLRSFRLKRAAELLKQNYGTVLEVAFEVGFSNSSYFAKCFKEQFHCLPSEYPNEA